MNTLSRLKVLAMPISLFSPLFAGAAPTQEYLCYAQCARIDTQQNTVCLQGSVIGTSRVGRAQALRSAAIQCGSGTLVKDVALYGSNQSHHHSDQDSANGNSQTYDRNRRGYWYLDYDHYWRSNRNTWHFSRDGQMQFTLRLFTPSDCTLETITPEPELPPPPYGTGQPVYP